MRVAGHLAVYPGAAQLLHRDLLAEHGLDHFGPRDEHFRYVLDDEHEVGQGGRIDGSAGAGTQNHRNLRDHAARKRIAEENLAVARQRVDPFLNAGSARVVDSDQRNAHVQRIIHDLRDFTGVHEAERAAGHGKVLCEDSDGLTADHARADDDAVSRKRLVLHSEIAAVMLHEHIVFVERALVEQRDNTLARGHLAHGLLLLDGLGPSAEIDLLLSLLEFENFLILY